MAAKGKFSYFYGEDLGDESGSSSSDENISEEDKDHTEKRNLSFITKSEKATKETDIPSAKLLLEKRSDPEFLKHRNKNEVDWDRLTKDKTYVEEEVDLSNTHAIPPPQTYEPQTNTLAPTLGVKADNQKPTGAQKRAYSVQEGGDADDAPEEKQSKGDPS